MLAALCLSVLVCAQPTDLTPVDRAAGWRDYTGADATALWRSYRGASFPAKGWVSAAGELRLSKNTGAGDIVTVDQFRDVEMTFDFKMGEKSNSGIMWRVAEKHDTPWQTGPEYQLLDDAGFGAKPTDAHAVGALYDLYPPAAAKVARPAGEWNTGRIRLRNGVVQHWLNDVKVVEATIFDDAGRPTPEWLAKIGVDAKGAAVAEGGSKFKVYPGFGVQPAGHIAIQDHGDTDLALRNVRIRDLAAALPGEVRLFNGTDLTGWVGVARDEATKTDGPVDTGTLASVRDGVIVIKGQPIGYLRTKDTYTNYVLRLEWRFDPSKGAGNSGVLVRMVGADKVWPKSVEAQLHSGNAGDFWNIDSFTMTTDPARTKARNTKKSHGAERPLGEWNEYEIIVHRGDVVLKVNGEELNRATNVEQIAGHICLQSEGAEIHIRNVRLAPLP
ncbi:MAG: DUF1080 domain-containing protein [Planctomycetota bacterium]|nr:DUF1080 domain-containing protein [Planctomycetota bacterium]